MIHAFLIILYLHLFLKIDLGLTFSQYSINIFIYAYRSEQYRADYWDVLVIILPCLPKVKDKLKKCKGIECLRNVVNQIGKSGATGIISSTGVSGKTGPNSATGNSNEMIRTVTGSTGIQGATSSTSSTGITGETGATSSFNSKKEVIIYIRNQWNKPPSLQVIVPISIELQKVSL